MPVLAHRFTRERLRALAQAEGTIAKDGRKSSSSAFTTPGAARWQPRSWSSAPRGAMHVRSAGSTPARDQPGVVEAMPELGVDMTEAFPKPLTDEVVHAADVVITMGCGDACPIYPGKHTRTGSSTTRPARTS